MKQEFPILKDVTYLDNAATTQKPLRVINKIKEFYETSNANTHRGIYKLSVNATNELESSRETVSKFLNASPNEIFFTKNASEGFNILALSLQKKFKKTKEGKGNIVSTILEHHSNFLPWQNLAKELNFEFKIAKPEKHPEEKNFSSFDCFNNFENQILKLVDDNTKIVSFTAMSNVSGLILNSQNLIKKIREKNKSCIIIIDSAQSIAHQPTDVKIIDCDFLVFSGHKIYGPLGVGVVFGKESLLKELDPIMLGGGMVLDYKNEEFQFMEHPHKFEYGSIDVASIIGLKEALLFFSETKQKYSIEKELQDFAVSELKKISGVKILGHNDADINYGPVISFVVEGIHPHDLASIADSFNVCIRAGHHCAKPFLNFLEIDAISRVSISFYNDLQDILKLVDAIKKAKVIFNE